MSEPSQGASEQGEEEPSWVDENPWKARAIGLVVMLLLFEGVLQVLAARQMLPWRLHPTTREPAWNDYIDPVVGLWHHRNSERRHARDCFDVTYRSNAYGMRDRERSPRSDAPRRVLLLGSSLAEGHGVEREERYSDRLEARTGIEHMNFAVTGGMSSIMEWLLYERVVEEFDHTHLFISFVPFNDFAENRPGTYPDDRYRPYLRRNNDEYEVFYTVAFEDRYQVEPRSTLELARNAVLNRSLVADVGWRSLQRVLVGKQAPELVAEANAPLASYDRGGPEDIEILLYTYERIAALAGDRPVWILMSPYDGGDFVKVEQDGYDFALVRTLKAFADRHENIHFVDLLPHFLERQAELGIHHEEFELGCDSHWNALGHEVAAEAIYQAIWAPEGL